ncbi:hypothetical protein N7532_001218 [Penicillium argentinense]|uniref:Uncharacterized protein n=1 Tax=Penicillium argentinense TaxID=1131581 RepID=A0A9W9KM85_9EURO|nr:uncharacterized protein N7532_001218 [Penicillium argentinense]KAJ5110683.1 hypothetical protein N7532_001218 [Penicillium argentinense]
MYALIILMPPKANRFIESISRREAGSAGVRSLVLGYVLSTTKPVDGEFRLPSLLLNIRTDIHSTPCKPKRRIDEAIDQQDSVSRRGEFWNSMDLDG